MISAMALLGCLAFGSVFVNWRTVGKVDTKIRAGLTVGAHAVGNVVAPGRAGGPCEPPLGDRPSATITASTSFSASEPPPRWSYWVLARTSVFGRVDIPSLSNAVLLETDPYNEIGEASGDIVLSDAVPRHVCALWFYRWSTGRPGVRYGLAGSIGGLFPHWRWGLRLTGWPSTLRWSLRKFAEVRCAVALVK